MYWTVSIVAFFAVFVVIGEAVQCYNCTNFDDKNKYCETSEIHHMETIDCPIGRCIYYDFSRGLFTF